MVGAPLGPQSVNLGARVQSQPPEPVQTRFCVLPGCRPVGQKCRFGPGAGGLDQTPGGLDLALFLAICTDSSPEAPPQCDPAPLCHMFTRWEESHLVHTVPISAAIVPDRDSPPLIKTDPGHSWNQLPPYPPPPTIAAWSPPGGVVSSWTQGASPRPDLGLSSHLLSSILV